MDTARGGASNYKNSLQSVINLANSGMSIGTLQCLFNSQLNTNGNYLAVSKFDVSSNITLIVDTSNGGGLFSSFIKDGSGTLQLNIAQNSFACDISHNNGSINFNTYGDCIYYSKLSGAGTVNKNGSGNLTIINDNTNYTGTINVNSGRLTVNGILSSASKIIVNNGATLTGSGTVGNVTICTSGNIMASGGTNGLTINAVSCLQPLVAGDGIAISYNTNNLPIVSLSQSIFYTTMTSANNLYNVNITSQYNPSVITLIFNNCYINTGITTFLSNMTVQGGYMEHHSQSTNVISYLGLTTAILNMPSASYVYGIATLRRISTISSIITASVYNISIQLLTSSSHVLRTEGTINFSSLNNLTINIGITPDLTKIICTYQI